MNSRDQSHDLSKLDNISQIQASTIESEQQNEDANISISYSMMTQKSSKQGQKLNKKYWKTVSKCIDKLFTQLERKVGERIDRDFCELDFFGFIARYFLEYQRDARPEEYLTEFLTVYDWNVRGKCDSQIIQKTMEAKNLVGRIFRYKNDEDLAGNVTQTLNQLTKLVDSQRENKMETLVDKLFVEGYQNINFAFSDQKHKEMHSFRVKSIKFIAYFNEYKKIQLRRQLVKEGQYDKFDIDRYCTILMSKDLKYYTRWFTSRKYSIKEQAIIKLYQTYIKENTNNENKNRCYQLIQYLIDIKDDKFEQEFSIQSEQDIDMLVKFVNENDVNNLEELRMKANICKHTEYNSISINLSDQFKLEDVPDDVIINLLDNIGNRLQIFSGSFYIITHRLNGNIIKKFTVTDSNQQEIEDMLQQFNDGNLYDVIINSKHAYQNVQNIRLRYLNYYNQTSYYQLTLNHPEDLVSLSTFFVKISNMNNCINLRNLCNIKITYNSNDIVSLQNLRRFYSSNDIYQQSGAFLLQDLFKNYKPEYVHIQNDQPNSNVINSFVLRDNIEDLRCMLIEFNTAAYDIKLDVTKTVPQNLYVFNVDTWKDSVHKYGAIYGSESQADKIEQCLVHKLRRNN